MSILGTPTHPGLSSKGKTESALAAGGRQGLLGKENMAPAHAGAARGPTGPPVTSGCPPAGLLWSVAQLVPIDILEHSPQASLAV